MNRSRARNKIIAMGVSKDFKKFLEDTAKENDLYVSDLCRRLIIKGVKDKAFLGNIINQNKLPKKAFVI